MTCFWSFLLSAALWIYTQQRSPKQQAILAYLLTVRIFSEQHDLIVVSLLKNSKRELEVGCSSRTLSSCLPAVKGRKSREAIKPMPASSWALLATVEPFCLPLCCSCIETGHQQNHLLLSLGKVAQRASTPFPRRNLVSLLSHRPGG